MTSALTAVPDSEYDYQDVDPSITHRFAGTGTRQTIALQPISRRQYTWPMHRGTTERKSIDTFFRARRYAVEAFYVHDPEDKERTGVSLGTSVAAQTTFSLPSSGEESRYYPSTMTVYDDAVATTATFTVHTDGQTVGLSTAPTSGSVMTADLTGYRLVQLAEEFRWRRAGHNWWFAAPEFIEVPA